MRDPAEIEPYPKERPLPTVSAIVVVKNGERFLEQALASISAQTLAPLEIVVVDGGSTDGTRALASAVPGVRIVEQSGSGIADAYNAGIRAAEGELLTFLSHDDRWTPQKLEFQAARMAEAPELDFVIGHVRFFLEPGHEPPLGFRRSLLEGEHVGRIMETLCVRRRAFERIGMFDPTLAISEDVDWYARASDANLTMEVLPQVLVEKRVHDRNASLSSERPNRDLLQALRRSVRRKTLGVSVVIPVKDGARYLAEAIESVLAQTRPPSEVLVVDDGSSDGSVLVAESFGGPVRCLVQQAAGVGAARNRGVAEARGPLLAFLDADDLWLRDKLELQTGRLAADPGLSAVFAHAAQFLSPELSPSERARVAVPAGSGPGFIAGTLLVRKSAFLRVGWFPTHVRVGEFVDWYARAKDVGLEMELLDRVLLRRRIHTQNLGREASAERTDYARVLKAALDRRRAGLKPPS